MKKTKAVSLLLSLSMIASLIMPGTFAMPTYAAEPDSDSDKMVLSKNAVKDVGSDTYTITLEAYATGKTTITEVDKGMPTDIVLVLDQSGSMDESMPNGTYTYRPYFDKSNKDYYKNQEDLYYLLDNGNYVKVSVKRKEKQGMYVQLGESNNRTIYYSSQNYYTYYVKNGAEYQPVTVKREGKWNDQNAKYTYSLPNGEIITTSSGDYNYPDLGTWKVLYYYDRYSRDYSYTYTYTDQNNKSQTLGTSDGSNTQPGYLLYKRDSTTRLDALKMAATTFVESVREKAAGADEIFGNTDDVEHRIAVVGFASGKTSYTAHPSYENTELFIGSTQYNYKGDSTKNEKADQHYNEALQDMRSDEEYQRVLDSIGVLAASGATHPEHGLDMAKGIFEANPVSKERNQIVILFTDGAPGETSYSDTVAGDAVKKAGELKPNVTVYSVGIFAGANATADGIAEGATSRDENLFMQKVSSNNGIPQDPSYYLSAADAETLNAIFKNISNRIPTSGTSVELKAESVIKDTISPYFQIPEDAAKANVAIKTCEYLGTNNGKISWGSAVPESGVTYTIADDDNDGNKEIKVTGFDFSANWCGMEEDKAGNKTPHGKKLQISFKVEAKPEFLGGNGVPTNGPAGVSKNENDAKDNKFLLEFPEKPEVDVAIKDIQISAPEKNVYLLQNIPGKDIKSGITAKVGNVDLNLDAGASNYGLEDWQNEFVTIDVKIKAADGTEIGNDLAGLSDDSKYTVSITVSPKKTEGAAKESTNNGEGKINVFKPELTFKDSEAYYGEKVTEDFSSSNKSGENWKHGEGENVVKDDNTGITMIGKRPDLDIGYTPNDGMLDVKTDGKYYTKKDVPVKATVKIGAVDVTENTSFLHACDSNNCDWQNPTTKGDPAFKIHVKTCQLTITKNGGTVGEPYVFTVKRNGNDYSEVTVGANESATIYELPVGTYTIEEDTGWSWRYASNCTGSAILSAPTAENSQSYMGTITCTNTKTNNKWLNGFSSVVQNIYNKANN